MGNEGTMRFGQGDIWDSLNEVDAICVTTNGIIKADGKLVMGAGIAKQARDRFPGIDFYAGGEVLRSGSHVRTIFQDRMTRIVSLPTKQHWRDPSPFWLVDRSLTELVVLVNKMGWETILLTRPGCGHGGLDWETQVKPLCEKILDERFCVVAP